MKKRLVVVLVVLMTLVSVCAGWAQQKPSVFQGNPKETYYMVMMVSGVEY